MLFSKTTTGIYLILDPTTCAGRDIYTVLEMALKGGVRIVQLRDKGASKMELFEKSKKVSEITKSYGATFIVNDDPEIASRVGADGVHVGQLDTSIVLARSVVGDKRIVGVSTHSFDQVKSAIKEQVSYIAFGSIFETGTKKDFKLVGLDNLRGVCKMTSKAVVAIGGIKLDNLEEVLDTGVKIIAISSGICASDDPFSVALRFSSMVAKRSKE